MDATRDLPGMIELVEPPRRRRRSTRRSTAASVGWDGSDPIRRTDR
jgi:hypothetical protein